MTNDKMNSEIYNRPGLPSLAYRIGDWATFRRRMLGNLTKQGGNPEQPDNRPLAKLNTRANDDPAIALLDAWAIVADVLTFYQERIANEGYLHTATEQRSVVELARTIGYELNPGVAASTFLAFAVEDTPTSPSVVKVPKGTQVVSLPQGEDLPQTFETSAEIIAHVHWNGLKPRLTKPQEINADTEKLYLQGIATQLQPGDRILLIDAQQPHKVWYLLTLLTVETKPEAGYTAITWDKNLLLSPLLQPQVFAFRQRATLFGYNAPKWQDMPDDIKRNFGGTINGGIFRTSNDGQNWTAFNHGLPTTDIRALAFNRISGKLFVGTEGSGVFRYQEDKEKWLAVNVGLTNLNIQTLYIDNNGYLFAGTPSGGVFSSKDNGENWAQLNNGTVGVRTTNSNNFESLNTSLTNTVVRAIITFTTRYGEQGTGTITSDSTTVTGSATFFTTELREGDIITASGQSRTVRNITDGSLTIDAPFIPNLSSPTPFITGGTYIFAGTDEGIYRSLDQGKNWHLKPMLRMVVRSLVAYHTFKQATGKISGNTTTLTGNGTSFTKDLRVGDPIIANNQKTNVTHIESDTVMIVDSKFDNLSDTNYLVIDEHYIFAGTDNGIYRFKNQNDFWDFRGLQGENVRSLVTYESRGTHYIFAATSKGVSISTNHGERWDSMNTDLTDRDVQGLDVDESNGLIYATTKTGAFRMPYNGSRWKKIHTESLHTDIISLLAYSKIATGTITSDSTDQKKVIGNGTKFTQELKNNDVITVAGQTRNVSNIESDTVLIVNENLTSSLNVSTNFTINHLFTGTAFAGFLEDKSVDSQKPEWPNFQIEAKKENGNQKLDLDSLYPKILPDSWIVLVREDNTHAKPCQVKSASTVALEKFGLTAKVTEIETETDVTSQNHFGLRETIVLVNSEQLNLVAEPLTVVAKQHEIFQEPIRDRQIYLREYVPGLQVDKTLIVSGKYIRAKIKNIAGVYCFKEETWAQKNTGLSNTVVRSLVSFSTSDNNYLFAGTEGGVFKSKDNGENWQPINEELTSRDITALAINQAGDIFAGTASDGIFRLKFDSTIWQPVNKNLTNKNITALVVDRNHRIFAGTTKGGIYLSTDNGESWANNNNGLTNSDINCLVFRVHNNIDLLFAGTTAGIFRYQYNIGSWQSILSDINVTAVDINQAEDIFAGTADSGVQRFQQQTQQWESFNDNLQDVHIRCLIVDGEDNIFVGTDSGGVFRVATDSRQWEEVNQGLRNIDVRAITKYKNEIYIGGIGILTSPDTFTYVELKIGDLLQVMSVPIVNEKNPKLQKWHLRDRNGVDGYIEISDIADIELLPANIDDETVSEVCAIATPPEDQILPILKLQQPLQNCYDPETTIVYGNVVGATHGETIQEVLGSGNGTSDNQRFTLKKPPLTYIAAQTPSGNKSTLEVYVDGVRWEEVRFLFGLSNFDQNYITRIDDDGITRVIFGDGKSGARLPTGQENIFAIYRSGIGLGGNLAQNQLTQLKTRPLGIQGVTNPVPATGAAPRESMEEARISAPLTVQTLDRIVSLQDFEDFTRAFAGIGKAQVKVVQNGATQIVHLTIGAIGGAAVLPDSSLYQNLVKAIDTARDPIQVAVQVDSYKPLYFNVDAKIIIDSRRLPEPVLAAVRQAIKAKFAFENRLFSQPVTSAEAIAAMQSVPGVIAVDLDGLYLRDFSKTVAESLIAQEATWNQEKNQISPAEMLLLNPNGITLTSEIWTT